MKKPIFLFIALCCFLQLEAQDQAIQQFYKKYKTKEEVPSRAHHYWAKKLLPGFYSRQWIENLMEDGSLKMIVLDAEQIPDSDLNQLKAEVEKAAFDLLVDVKSKGESLKFYTRNDKRWITNLLFIAVEDGEFAFLDLVGKWTVHDIINRSRSID